jgi:uncharacterized membrane protein YqgA involved in biofilm formation
MLTGTLVNVAAIVAGATLGLAIGRRLSNRVRGTLMAGLGLAVLMLGWTSRRGLSASGTRRPRSRPCGGA